ncbi:GAF domain-containing protein [Arthrobacter sp. B2I5]|jgi:GAF domain-containing protein|uniref:GAF and ANTAR domain-containing protein n=1 Tax=Arthrobacter sp. B2I5 TaxID=3042266 RepID=UPI002789798D|nr:GAF and ANTAR domain-containing protein [Arthrobacter sp. B2I5]MDQ0824202.1 GAF domain-containing protein [Arthrobacter sp. B2I5]
MAHNDAVTAADEYQDLLLNTPEFSKFLLGLATISASQLGGDGAPVECTVTVERDGALSTFAYSSEEGRRLDETQYSFGTGPCLTALREQHTVLIEDLQLDQRWAPYTYAVAKLGVRSALAVPIHTDPLSQAALNCYAHTVHAFGPDTVRLVEDQAASMSRILRLALRLHAPEVFPADLRAALKSRAVVDAAVALVMLQARGSRDGALELLQAAAKSGNRRIQEIAQEIVARGSFSAGPGKGEA